jgi:hypothetical protein
MTTSGVIDGDVKADVGALVPPRLGAFTSAVFLDFPILFRSNPILSADFRGEDNFEGELAPDLGLRLAVFPTSGSFRNSLVPNWTSANPTLVIEVVGKFSLSLDKILDRPGEGLSVEAFRLLEVVDVEVLRFRPSLSPFLLARCRGPEFFAASDFLELPEFLFLAEELARLDRGDGGRFSRLVFKALNTLFFFLAALSFRFRQDCPAPLVVLFLGDFEISLTGEVVGITIGV